MRRLLPWLLVLLLGACAQPAAAPPAASESGQTTSVSPTPTATPCWRSPLTGECSDESAPVLVVKIDDVGAARPQFHLNEADVIIVEPVEGGLTRLFAVYQTVWPDVVGPVRSARITDTDLVPAFGRPAFAYSGAMTRLRPYLEAAQLQLVGAPQGGSGYERINDRAAPHNLIARPGLLRKRLADPVAAQLKGAGWSFGTTAPSGAKLAVAEVSWPGARKKFVWRGEAVGWQIYIYGETLWSQTSLGGQKEIATADNVLIMQSELLDSPFGDKFGARTPYPQTLGTGAGWVLSRGRAVAATWSRPSLGALPQWLDAAGNPVALAPGRTWWLIVEDLATLQFKLRSVR